MQNHISISLVMSPGKNVFDTQEEILKAADWYKVREKIKISVDLLSNTMQIFCADPDFIDYLRYSYVDQMGLAQRRGA